MLIINKIVVSRFLASTNPWRHVYTPHAVFGEHADLLRVQHPPHVKCVFDEETSHGEEARMARMFHANGREFVVLTLRPQTKIAERDQFGCFSIDVRQASERTK